MRYEYPEEAAPEENVPEQNENITTSQPEAREGLPPKCSVSKPTA
jgi:hypothetical protein